MFSPLSLATFLPSLTALVVMAATFGMPPDSGYGQSDTSAAENDPLTTYKGKNRVVLVFGSEESNADFAKQMAVLKDKVELTERQIVVLPILADDKAAGKSLPFLQKKYNKGGTAFSVVLIGKDGDDAFHSEAPVSAESLYGKIDAMPMRQDEIKAKSAETDQTRGESKTDKQKDN